MAMDRIVRDCESVHGYVGRVCFKKGPPRRVGAEIEWLVASPDRPLDPPPLPVLSQLQREADPLPGGSRLTLEPGGQVELSSSVADSMSDCWYALRQDTLDLCRHLARHHLAPVPAALDPVRPAVRLLSTPRYDAMQAFFDARGRDGLAMMSSTAALQVNLDAGADDADVAARWRLLHALGPVLVAVFANSPLQRGRPTGWKSTRQRIWSRVEPAEPQPDAADPVAAWAEFALDAPVMMVRGRDRWRADPGYRFRDWVAGAGSAPPTEDDLAYHLTTLFPPVRPRGWLEVRYVDAQPGEWWAVPVAVLTALTADATAADLALAATAPVAGRWTAAARDGLADPDLRSAAAHCVDAALAALPRLGTDPALTALVEAFAERYVARGRSPADDLLDPAAPTKNPPPRDRRPQTLPLEIR